MAYIQIILSVIDDKAYEVRVINNNANITVKLTTETRNLVNATPEHPSEVRPESFITEKSLVITKSPAFLPLSPASLPQANKTTIPDPGESDSAID